MQNLWPIIKDFEIKAVDFSFFFCFALALFKSPKSILLPCCFRAQFSYVEVKSQFMVDIYIQLNQSMLREYDISLFLFYIIA